MNKLSSNDFSIPFRSRPLSGHTTIVGTLGWPIHHVISPEIFGATFEITGADMVLIPLNVEPGYVGDAVRGIRALGIRGTMVTMPHKQACMEFLDEIDPIAKTVGAVNAITNTDGVLKGFNFDIDGAMTPFRGGDLAGKKVLQLGAGGGGSAMAFAMVKLGAELTILNIDPSWATDLAKKAQDFFGKPVRGGEYSIDNLSKEIRGVDMVVNSTSIGFADQEEMTPVPAEMIQPEMTVYDMVFTPLETRFQREAKERGAARVIGGLQMLVGQASHFFETVTGIEAPYEEMLDIGRNVLLSRRKQQ